METLADAGVTPVVMEVHDNAEPYVSEGARALLAAPTTAPTAVLCFSDLMAAAVVHAAEDAGLRVPEDISVVGFDDSPLARAAASRAHHGAARTSTPRARPPRAR